MTALTLAGQSLAANAGTAAAPTNLGRSAPKIRWLHGSRDPIALGLAARMGLRPQTVEHLMRHVGLRCAEIIRGFREGGADVRLERFYAPIRAAYDNRKTQPLTPELAQWANEADSAEDRCELKFWQTRSDKDLSMDIRALDTEIARQITLRDAMAAEEQRRMNAH